MLLTVRGEIEALLKRHNLCASIMLCGRHQMEALLWLEATWSRARLEKSEHGQSICLQSNHADYGGDREAQKRDLESTVSMIQAMRDILGFTSYALDQLDGQINERLDVVSGPLTRVDMQ